jgi:hypothetical protein
MGQDLKPQGAYLSTSLNLTIGHFCLIVLRHAKIKLPLADTRLYEALMSACDDPWKLVERHLSVSAPFSYTSGAHGVRRRLPYKYGFKPSFLPRGPRQSYHTL